MEWQQLLGFYQVAKLGSFTKAAEATFRTQSALSQQVKALEDEFSTRLFDRMGRNILPTQAGETLYRYAREIVRLKEQAGLSAPARSRASISFLRCWADSSGGFLKSSRH